MKIVFKKIFLLCLFIAFVSLFLPGSVQAISYYVDNSCSTNGNGITQTCGFNGPFNSLSNAQTGVTGNQSDNSLLLKRGQTFNGQFTIGAYGTAGHQFTISAYGSGNKPIITGGNRNLMVNCSSCRYIVIDGLEFSYPSGNTNIYIQEPANHITILNSYIHHASSYGIYIWRSSYNTIDSNDVSWSGSEGINIRMGTPFLALPDNVISNNKIHHNKRYGVLTNGESGLQLDGNGSKIFGNEIYNNSTGVYLVFTNNFDIYNNNLHNNGKDCQGTNDCPGEDYGFAIQSGSYNYFHNNIISYTENTGIGIYGEQSSPGNNADGNRVFYNVIYGTILGEQQQKDVEWQSWSGNSVGNNNQFCNNILYGTTGSRSQNFVIDDTNPAIGGNLAYNNVFYGANDGVYFEGTSSNAGWTFKNNIFAGNSNYSIYAAQRSSGLTLFNNIYYKQSGGTLVTYKGTSFNSTNIKSLDANALSTDPKFIGTSVWSDFRLQSTSSAIDTGVNLGTPFNLALDPNKSVWPPVTLDQNSYGSGWEIGAFVYKEISTSPTISPYLKPGDANGDGKVDDLDYTIWANNYGITNATGPRQGDFNNDKKVDDLDYTIWANNYGR